jgi:hypothetical protein
VGSYQIVVDFLNGQQINMIGSATGTGFMTSPTALSSRTEYRWFNLDANGQLSGNLTVPVTIAASLPANSSFQILLNPDTNFKDTGGAGMPVHRTIPLSVTVSVITGVTVPMVFQALDAYFGNSVYTPIGRIPSVSDEEFSVTHIFREIIL